MQAVSPSLFYQFASKKPQYWVCLEGQEIVHNVWGSCSVEKVDLSQRFLIVDGKKVALEYFRDDLFSGLYLPTDIVMEITTFQAKQIEINKLTFQRRIEINLGSLSDRKIKQIKIIEQENLEEYKLAQLEKAKRRADELEEEKKAGFTDARVQKVQTNSIEIEAERLANFVVESIRKQKKQHVDSLSTGTVSRGERASEVNSTNVWNSERQAIINPELDQERIKLIKESCAIREVEHLIHFTRIENLANIIKMGLISRDKLDTIKTLSWPKYNDEIRYDGHKDAICLSISFPNYLMFYKYNCDDPAQWVVIQLNRSILWELDCAYYRTNAASNSVRFSLLENLKTYQSFVEMFGNSSNKHPEDPQAEVLVFNRIPPYYINGLHFYSRTALKNWTSVHPKPLDVLIESSEYYYRPH